MERVLKDTLTSRWFIQGALGVLLIILLGVHLIVNHWAAPNGLLSYADIIRYYDVPGITWMEILFLIVVTAHCFIGLQAILLDMTLTSTAKRLLTWILVVAAGGVIIYGSWLIWEVKNFVSSGIFRCHI